MLACVAGVHCLHRVPMIRRADHDGVDVLPLKQFTVVTIGFALSARPLMRLCQPIAIHIANSRDIRPSFITQSQPAPEVSARHAADTDVAEGQPIVCPSGFRSEELRGNPEADDPAQAGHA